MTHFREFAAPIRRKFEAMSAGELFVVPGDGLFDAYLDAFPAGTNVTYRTRRVYDCSCCHNFIRNVGRVVSVAADCSLDTIWNVPELPEPFAAVAAALHERVRNSAIDDLFRTKEPTYGATETRELLTDGTVWTWEHFSGRVGSRHLSNAPATARGDARSAVDVMARSFESITLDALTTVIDLITEGGLYRGAEFKAAVSGFFGAKRTFDALPAASRPTWLWTMHGNRALSGFKNSVIGSLVTDLSAGVPVEDAVRMFESKVAPQNYKRPTAVITKKMIDDALETIRDLGLEPALARRHARLEDVAVTDVLFVDNAVRAKMRGGLGDLLYPSARAPVTAPVADRATPIAIDDFVSTVLPAAVAVDLLLENKHVGNFVSLTAPDAEDLLNRGVPPLFKWGNGVAWSYDGDVTDSIKARVKKAGGNVSGKVRVSLAWFNTDDLDLHVVEPGKSRIFFGNKHGLTGGRLDVDMNVSIPVRDAVENIVWPTTIPDGRYRVLVDNYTKRESIDVGFTLEFEFDGVVRTLSFNRGVTGTVACFAFDVKNGALVDTVIEPGLTLGSNIVTKWGNATQNFVPVDTILLSPNHWQGQTVGAKHHFFILAGCTNPEPVRGVYNEFLRSNLEPHRKVFELLGAKTKAPFAERQMSGIGFTAGRADTVVVQVRSAAGVRAYRVQF